MPRPELDLEIPPLVTASVLLAARHFALVSDMSWPGSKTIVAATGASLDEAHAIEVDPLARLA